MTSRRALLTGLGAASASLAGCNSAFSGLLSREVPADWTPGPGEWCGGGYDQAYSGHNPHASPPKTKPSVSWGAGADRPSVAVADRTVFLREPESLRGLEVDDGTEAFAVDRPSGWSLRYVDGRLYDLTPARNENVDDVRENGLHALTLDGVPEWDDPVRYTDWIGSFVEREGYVYVCNGTETIHCHDTGSGERVDATVHDVAVRVLANRDGVLYAGLDDDVAAYDVADDGSLDQRWRRRGDAADDVASTGLVVGRGRALLRQQRRDDSGQTTVSIFDVEAAEVVGTVDFDPVITQFVAGTNVYVATRAHSSGETAGGIHALDGTGERWSVDLAGTPTWLTLADGTLYVGSAVAEGKTIAIDAEDGDERWHLDAVHPMAVVGETVYALTEDERFVALRS